MSKPIYDNTGDGPFGPIVNGTQIVFFEYRPNKAAGFTFLVLFGLCTFGHLLMLARLRAWFFIPFILGGLSEAFGYFGRTQASDRPSEAGPFILQNMLILVGAPCLAATVYMSLGRVAAALDAEDHAVLNLRWTTKLYVLIDFVCIGTQFVGSIIPASGEPEAVRNGRTILLAGIIAQFTALSVFAAQVILLEVNIRRVPPRVLLREPSLKWERHFRAIEVVTVLMFVRALVRAVEYLQGPGGNIISHEVYLYAFDAVFMLLAMIVFLVIHPRILIRRSLASREAFGDMALRKKRGSRCCCCC